MPQHELVSFCMKEKIHLMAHQPLGGRPVAVVNPNANRSGPLEDSTVSHVLSKGLLTAMSPTTDDLRVLENEPQELPF